MAKYVYPAVFTPEEKGMIAVSFPDVAGCYASGIGLMDALEMAQDALALMLCSLEKDGQPIPQATPVKQIEADADSFVSLILCDTTNYPMTDEQTAAVNQRK